MKQVVDGRLLRGLIARDVLLGARLHARRLRSGLPGAQLLGERALGLRRRIWGRVAARRRREAPRVAGWGCFAAGLVRAVLPGPVARWHTQVSDNMEPPTTPRLVDLV